MSTSRIPGSIGGRGFRRGNLVHGLSGGDGALPGSCGLTLAPFSGAPPLSAIPVPQYARAPHLAAATARGKAAAPVLQQLPILREGSRGEHVARLQTLLNARCEPSPGLPVDAVFGPATRDVVVTMQRAAGLPADAIVGKRTWGALLAHGPIKMPTTAPASASAASAAKSAASPPALTAQTPPGVASWPLADKFKDVLIRTGPKLPEGLREEFQRLVTPQAAAIMAGTLVVWAGAHFFGFGFVADLLALLAGLVFIGTAVFEAADNLASFGTKTVAAASEADLDEAAGHLERAIVLMGVTAFIALVARMGARGGAGATAEKAAATPGKTAAAPRGPRVASRIAPPKQTLTTEAVTNMPKGQRPPPPTYMSEEAIAAHLKPFESGAVKVVKQAPEGGAVGPPQGTYVMPKAEVDKAVAQAAGDVGKLEEILGLPKGELGKQPMLVDVKQPTGLRFPTGNEPGANAQWRAGGYTSGGMPEAVVDQIQPGNYTVRPVFSK
jgi:hypothetical protein